MTNEELIKKIETQINFEKKSESEYNIGRRDAYTNVLILFKQLEEPEITEEQAWKTIAKSTNRPVMFWENMRDNYLSSLKEPKITEEQALNKLAESYPFSKDGINAILQAQLAGYSPVSTMKFIQPIEPELPVIPQFVADWIEENKSKFSILDLAAIVRTEGLVNQKVDDWICKNDEMFVRAWIDGYTIELGPQKTRQVLVKFFDNEEYRTELTEDAARELIEFLEAKR